MEWARDSDDVRGKWTTKEGWRVYSMPDGLFRAYDPLGGYRTGDTVDVCMDYADEMQAMRAA